MRIARHENGCWAFSAANCRRVSRLARGDDGRRLERIDGCVQEKKNVSWLSSESAGQLLNRVGIHDASADREAEGYIEIVPAVVAKVDSHSGFAL